VRRCEAERSPRRRERFRRRSSCTRSQAQ
jgi:hypothetical protein